MPVLPVEEHSVMLGASIVRTVKEDTGPPPVWKPQPPAASATPLDQVAPSSERSPQLRA